MTKGEGKRKKNVLLVVHRRFFILIYQLKVTKIAGYPAKSVSGASIPKTIEYRSNTDPDLEQ